MVYFKLKKINGNVYDFDKKCDRVDWSAGETFTSFAQTVQMDDGETGQIIHAIIRSEEISEIIRYEEDEPVNEEAEKPKKTTKKK